MGHGARVLLSWWQGLGVDLSGVRQWVSQVMGLVLLLSGGWLVAACCWCRVCFLSGWGFELRLVGGCGLWGVVGLLWIMGCSGQWLRGEIRWLWRVVCLSWVVV